MSTQSGSLHLIQVDVPDNGAEVLWCEHIGAEMYRILSVPVFAYDVSRDAVVQALMGAGPRLKFSRVLQPSSGTTIRCFVASHHRAGEAYAKRISPDAMRMGLHIGPVTIFDPDVVALHIARRDQLREVATYLNSLVQAGSLRFWEPSDPAPPEEEDDSGDDGERWELVHPLPVDGTPVSVVT